MTINENNNDNNNMNNNNMNNNIINDLVINISSKEDSRFERDGYDLLMNYNVSLIELLS
jgi:DnaJ-class molecular chaperone